MAGSHVYVAIGAIVLVALILAALAIVYVKRQSTTPAVQPGPSPTPTLTTVLNDSSSIVPSGITTLISGSSTRANALPYDEVKKDIRNLIQDPSYRDQTYGPLFVRLAWHGSATFDPAAKIVGGSCPGTIRFPAELARSSNKGLELAAQRLASIKVKYPSMSFGDIYTLAGVVAIKDMEGPDVKWVPGRVDAGEAMVPTDGRLPDELKGVAHVKQIFGRMKFSTQETVALIGAHSIGTMHEDRSVVSGQWTQEPDRLDNSFFKNLRGLKWTSAGTPEKRHFTSDEGFVMLVSDMALLNDPELKKWVEIYAKDVARFKVDFGLAFAKLISNGCPVATTKTP